MDAETGTEMERTKMWEQTRSKTERNVERERERHRDMGWRHGGTESHKVTGRDIRINSETWGEYNKKDKEKGGGGGQKEGISIKFKVRKSGFAMYHHLWGINVHVRV